MRSGFGVGEFGEFGFLAFGGLAFFLGGGVRRAFGFLVGLVGSIQ